MSKGKNSDFIGKIIVIALIAVFVGVGIFTMVGKGSGRGMPPMGGMRPMAGGGVPRGATQIAAVTVSVKTIEKETIQKTVLLNGDVASKTQTSIYPDTSGKVSRLLKQVGDSVRKGEVIAYVDPSRPGSAYAVSPVTATVSGTVIQLPFNVGDTVNTAARLESNALGGQILISRSVADALKGRIRVTSLGNSIKLKGKSEDFEILRLDGLMEE